MIEFKKGYHMGNMGELKITGNRYVYPVFGFSKGYFEEETFAPEMSGLRQFDCSDDEGCTVKLSKEDESEWKRLGGRIFREWTGGVTFWYPFEED